MTTFESEKRDVSTVGAADGAHTAARGIKLVAEMVLPGASLLADGKLADGGLHLAAGVAARILLGPLGFFLVAANSYTKSVTGKNIHQHLGSSIAGMTKS